MTDTVGVSIATIPLRPQLLARALNSVCLQSRQVDQINVWTDKDGVGAPAAKNKAFEAITTDWVAFLDDDDEFKPTHIDHLLRWAQATGADMVYPWFDCTQPWPAPCSPDDVLRTSLDGEIVHPFGVEFGPEQADWLRTRQNWIPTTVLARTELVREAGGFVSRSDVGNTCDDWGLWLRLLDLNANIVHLPERTWHWHGHRRHTSGQSWRILAGAR